MLALPERNLSWDLFWDRAKVDYLDETLVVVMSEMGRTPRINANASRDHWTHCYGMWFAGAGIRGGTVCGASDSRNSRVGRRSPLFSKTAAR